MQSLINKIQKLLWLIFCSPSGKIKLFLKQKKRFASFTIMELLVVMVLISIVIGSGALLFLQFNRYLNANVQQANAENTILLFNQAFKYDINQPNAISATSDEIVIDQKGGNKIVYSFDPGFIVRSTNETIDTFRIEIKELKIQSGQLSGNFESIQAELLLKNCVYPFFVKKEYENIELFNKNIDK